MRLEKFIADTTNISRKNIKKLIIQKRIKVNNQIVLKSIQITENDDVYLDNKKLLYQKFSYFMLNKPQGYVCANEDKKHKTVFDLINVNKNKFFTYGRLDKDTEGLLIISNDGILAHQLLTTKYHIPKTYFVQTNIDISENIYDFNKPIILDNHIIKNYKFVKNTNNTCYLTIYSGIFHQVKRMMQFFGLEVTYLKRVQFGDLNLDQNLKLGQYRELTKSEINLLKNKLNSN
ncbi:pseudouridine synthase [Mycoplasma miroungirhinis]|uniref:Pseudouridine synthase n=1 Tax=Mycoplasma miroungirhinis TaxID=754516 RepID=A0A6M4JCS6_9MOLU|nr:pseudouridine synthase [Mycoplasma miroungirhinis]QJR44155.1 rRNA pseudouridine synthase [Mycoplasma miroungirhinis]